MFTISLHCFSLYCSGNTSEYRINGVQVILAKYLEELKKIGVVTKARNCLVLQVNSQEMCNSVVIVTVTCIYGCFEVT